MDGFSLTSGGLCINNNIPGCLQYNSLNNCSICEPNYYSNVGNICVQNGCVNITNDFKCNQCNSSLGFTLVNGICQIPYCIYASSQGC